MATKLYVGNLPYSMTDDQLKNIFSEAGDVISATVMVDKFNGRSRGFGFVEVEDGTKAVEMLNGREVDGRKLVVNEARPMTERKPRSFGGGGGGGGYDRRPPRRDDY